MLTQKVISWSKKPGRFTVTLDDGVLNISPVEEGAVRVRFTEIDEPPEQSLIFNVEIPAFNYQVKETSGHLTLSLPKIAVVINRANGSVQFKDASGKVVLSEEAGGRRLKTSTIQGEACYAIEQSFESPAGERLFGTGQFQDGYLNIKSLPRRLTQVNTQIAIPYFISNQGYGLLWHNYGLTDFNPADTAVELKKIESSAEIQRVMVTTSDGSREEFRQAGVYQGTIKVGSKGKYAFLLDVGQTMARGYRVVINGQDVFDIKNFWLPPTTSWFTELEAGEHTITITVEENDKPILRYRLAGNKTVLRSPVAEAIDYVVFAGNAEDVIAGYRRLTGIAPMMPLWALGYIHCRERYKSQAEILENAMEFRKRDLPVDLVVQDWQYWGKYGWNAMQFDEKDYPDPQKMVDDLHGIHAKLMVSVWSKIDPRSEVGKRFTETQMYIPGTDWVDFFNPEAAALYWENFSARLLSLGIDAWWQDATEPENDDLAGRKINNGNMAGEKMRLAYPLFVNKTVYEGSRRDVPDKRVFILSRSAFAGQQRYASATWSGDVGNDWETMRRQLIAGLGYMASGMPWWTFDAGGFFRTGDGQYHDPDYHERFIRWFQLATFSPLQRVHGYLTDTELWRYGREVEEQCKRYLDLRYRMLPYIYAQTAAVTFKNSTLMRPFIMDFADDIQAIDLDDEYMFGPSILVAPIFKPGVKTRQVYLPIYTAGWFNFWTGEKLTGGQTVKTDGAIDKIPLFIKAGSIVPLGPKQQYTSEKKNAPIELRIYTGADATFELYEDDGESYDYENGKYATIKISWNEENKSVTISEREGAFLQLERDKQFNLVWVGENNGIGIETGQQLQHVKYSGKELVVLKK